MKASEHSETADIRTENDIEGKGVEVRAHVFIGGKVQGVFFRSETKRMADSLDLKGWVRNLPDNKVEAVFEGRGELVDTMIEFCRIGPMDARVTHFTIVWERFVGEFRDFEIRY